MLETLRSRLSSSGREQTADLLKGIAVVLMIQVHVVQLLATPNIYESNVGRVSLFLGGPPAAPVFMAVMGYFLARTRKSLSALLRRGALLLIGGLALNIGLNFNLLRSIYIGRFSFDPLPYIFGADILTLAGLSVLVIGGLRPLFRNSVSAHLLSALAVVSVAPLLPAFGTPESPVLYYLNPFLWGDFSWSYFPLLPWLAYPLLGYSFHLARVRYGPAVSESFKVRVLVSSILAVGFLLTLDYGIGVSSHLPTYYHHGTLFAIWTAFFLLGWTMAASGAEKAFGKSLVFLYLKWLGRNVTSAYVFQWLIIGNIATEIYRTQHLGQVLVWFLLVLIATTVLVVSWRKHGPRLRLSANKHHPPDL